MDDCPQTAVSDGFIKKKSDAGLIFFSGCPSTFALVRVTIFVLTAPLTVASVLNKGPSPEKRNTNNTQQTI
jgi:hypothetical protein